MNGHFRIWDKQEQCYVLNIEDCLIGHDGSLKIIEYETEGEGGFGEMYYSYLQKDRYVVEFGIGYDDVNKIPIYRNDIVIDVKSKHIGFVDFQDLCWRMNPAYEPKTLYELALDGRLKVIGNTNQNHDLIEK